jgi:hypothetical protein
MGAQLEVRNFKNFNQTQHSTAAYDSLPETVKTDVILGNTAATLCFESRRVSRWKRRIDYSRFGRSQRRIEKHARTSKFGEASSKVVMRNF